MHSQRSKAVPKARSTAQENKKTVKKVATRKIATRTIATRSQKVSTPYTTLATPLTQHAPMMLTTQSFTTKSQQQQKSFVSTTTLAFQPQHQQPSFSFQSQQQLSFTPLHVQKRQMATFKKIGQVERTVLTAEQIAKQKEAAKKPEAAKAKKIPTLNDLMRQLYKKIHPDLMMAYPEQKEQNEKSLGTFQNFLAQLKTADGNEKYPVLKNASLPFFLRTPTPGHFQRVELFLHTDANLNKKAIEKQLCTFFGSIKLSSTFRWDDEYFPLKGKPDFIKEGGENEAAPEEEASSGPTGTETYDQFMERIKKEGEKSAKEQTM